MQLFADLALYGLVGVHICTCIVLHGYFSLGMSIGPTMKAADSSTLDGTMQGQDLVYQLGETG